MLEMEAFTQERLQRLTDWRAGEPLARIGRGKYGCVYACAGGVVKETRSSRRSCRQALREHAIALLQTLAVAQGCSPHLPLHYGAALQAGTKLRARMFMERFEGALNELGGAYLRCAADWQCLAFQVLSALNALALALRLAHNDCYPRNVLLSRAGAPACAYRHGSRCYVVPWRLFAAVTDFGVATCQGLLGGALPEVARSQPPLPLPPDFGAQPPTQHVLRYRSLPYYSRDLYTVLKWLRFPSELPRAPPELVRFAVAALRLLDEVRPRLCAADAQLDVFNAIFADDWLRSCGLQPFGSGARADFEAPLPPPRRAELLQRAAAALDELPIARSRATPAASGTPET
jgi:hypothetical protein